MFTKNQNNPTNNINNSQSSTIAPSSSHITSSTSPISSLNSQTTTYSNNNWQSAVPKVITPLDNKPIIGAMLVGDKTKALIPSNYSLSITNVASSGLLYSYHYSNGIHDINISEGNVKQPSGKLFDYQTAVDLEKSDSKNKFADFTYLGQPGVVEAQPIHNFMPTEYWIYYNHNGELVTVHTNDFQDVPLSKLIDIFKSLGK